MEVKEFLVGVAQNMAADIVLGTLALAYAWLVAVAKGKRILVAVARTGAVAGTATLAMLMATLLVADIPFTREWVGEVATCAVALSFSASATLASYLCWERHMQVLAILRSANAGNQNQQAGYGISGYPDRDGNARRGMKLPPPPTHYLRGRRG